MPSPRTVDDTCVSKNISFPSGTPQVIQKSSTYTPKRNDKHHPAPMKRVRTPIPFPEGVNGVNRLWTKGEKYYWLPTKRKKLPITDSKTINRLPTLSTFVFKKKSILYFLEATKLNFDSSVKRKEFPFCWYKYMYIATTNIKITEVRHWKYYPFIYFIEKAKVKNRTFLVSTDVTSLCSNTPPNEGIEWVCRAYKNFYEDNRPIPKPSRNA